MNRILTTILVLLDVFVSIASIAVTSQPRLSSEKGHLFIDSAGNVSIRAQAVNINGYEVTHVIAKLTSESHKDSPLDRRKLSDDKGSQSIVDQLLRRIERLEESLIVLNSTSVSLPSGSNSFSQPQYILSQLNSLGRRVSNTIRRVSRIERLLTKNECSSNPCQHGGTCEDSYNAFLCRCLPGWEGVLCELDVNECTRLANSDLGCQNGATCVNTVGSYTCTCPVGWFGLHCTQSQSRCDGGADLCANGVCVPKPGGFTCVCNQGWSSHPLTGACTVDVDECAGRTPPCSHDPAVMCVNVPGSFACGSCPAGYTGNGYYCTDVDECLSNNGGCSTDPRAQCINTRGSSTCASCPLGYEGDGRTCSYLGLCRINNGGCHPMATCISNSGLGPAVMCQCASGWTGSGVGPMGCAPVQVQVTTTPAPTGACLFRPCHNGGSCTATPQGYVCSCLRSFKGVNCETPVDHCGSQNPCQNGGSCLSQPDGFYCDCPDAFTGERCETKQEACGGFLRSEAGFLRYPHSNSTLNYPDGVNCGWVIITNRTLVLQVNFTRFSLEKSAHCSFDWLQIHDGPTSGSYQIGRFCGDKLPRNGTIISTHNSLYLWFRSDRSTGSEGFEIHWTSITPECGGQIELESHASISSPGSPGKYPANRDCWWEVTAPPSRRIQLHFFSLQIEEHANCSFDYLEVRDGAGRTDPVLARYCNTSHPPPLVTSSNTALLHFHSDPVGQDAGFQIAASAIEGVPGCGGVSSKPSGELQAPFLAENQMYLSNLDCVWRIHLPVGERISVEFTEFETEPHPQCDYDSLEIRDGPTRDSPLVGLYCGSQKPSSFISSGNQLYVRFKSDSSFEMIGFVLSYKVVCGGVFTSPTGIITSPYYPNSYPRDRHCVYEIILDRGKAVALEFQDFDLENYVFKNKCFFDSVKVRDGDNANATLIGSFCGKKGDIPDHPLLSTHNYMYIEFNTDGYVNGRGFRANYSAIDIKCGGILKERTGLIESPRESDGKYPSHSKCSWVLVAPPGFVVQLTFVSFVLEKMRVCDFDYVAVYDNSTSASEGTLIGRFCGRTVPPVLTSTDSIMTLVFRSDRSHNMEGFSATYTFLNQSQVCGGRYFSSNGILRSPGFPATYPPVRECEYFIQVPNGLRVNINVTDFDIEKSTNCLWDFLEIRNGGSNKSPLVGKYCGIQPPPVFLSVSNEVYVRFRSDYSHGGLGFRLEWNAAVQGCGGSISSPTGVISSPNYPLPYGRNADCFWSITSSQGSVLRVHFLDVDMEQHSTCNFDYLELWDGMPGVGIRIGRYCNSRPDPVLTRSSHLYVKFHSDAMISGRGFQIDYETRCNANLTGFRGVIESPNFPNNPSGFPNCTWIVTVPEGNAVNLTFSHLHLQRPALAAARFLLRLNGTNPFQYWREREFGAGRERQQSRRIALDGCIYSSITIKDIGGSDEKTESVSELGRFCGTSIPPTIVSKTNKVAIAFTGSPRGSRFRIEWVLNGCGGVFRRPKGQFTSPNYPNMYPHDRTCEWTITGEWGQSVELTVSDFSMEHMMNCIFDSLTVYGGQDDSAPVLTTLCHTQKSPVVVTSSGRQMFVRFISDLSFSGRGFQAQYILKDQGCGGLMTAPSGSLHSKNYPQNYGVYDDCVWQITVDANHVVRLDLVAVDINSNRDSCKDAYLKVYDGEGLDGPLLFHNCSTVGVESVTSTGNVMTVRMKSDGTREAMGFLARYFTACGARIITSGSGLIRSADAVNIERQYQNCSWIIMAADPGKRVTLTITTLVVSNSDSTSNSCEENFLAVHEGTDSEGALLGQYCGRTLPLPITSRGAALFVNLVSPRNLFHGWFSAAYSVLDTACGGTFLSESGAFATPGYPESYPTNVECVWYVTASAGNKVQLSFRSFNLEESPSCNDDYLEIRKENATGDLLGVFCGDEGPSNLTAAHTLWVMFRSNGIGSGPGFVADFALLHGNLDLAGPYGQVASPLYPNPYVHEGDFQWRIMVAAGKKINIRFRDFALEMFVDCSDGFLAIHDGFDESVPELFHGCGANLPDPLISSSNVVYLRLECSPVRRGAQFLLDWQEISAPVDSKLLVQVSPKDTCGGFNAALKPGTSVNVSSAGYPGGYGPSNCTWVFETSPGSHLAILFDDIDLEQSPDCVLDRVSVYTGDGGTPKWKLKNSLCKHNYSVIHTSNFMMVNFWADYTGNGSGFSGTVYSVCGGDLTGPNGFLDSQNISKTLQLLVPPTCEWTVKVRPGRTITVVITKLNIHSDASGCGSSYLLLKNGGSADSPILGDGKYCGETPPSEPIHTSSNNLFVKFRADMRSSQFRLQYEETSTNCGQDIRLSALQPYHVISSPSYPNIPPPYSECIWHVSAPHSERLTIDFIDRFDLTRDLDCRHNAVVLREGATESSELIGQFCTEKPASQTTLGNMLYMRYFTDETEPRNGFKANISIASCGGTVQGTTGVITSPSYPHLYPAFTRCEWRIEVVPQLRTMTISFLDMLMPGRMDRRCTDSLVISSKAQNYNETDVVLGTFCGRQLPTNVTSLSSQVSVVFQSNSSSDSRSRGFAFRFTANNNSECGGTLETPTGIIRSPGYPAHVPRARCAWHIRAPPGRRVKLTVQDLDLSASDVLYGSLSQRVFLYEDEKEMVFMSVLNYTIKGGTVFESTSNTMSIVLFSFMSSNNKGFHFEYDTNFPEVCGGTLPPAMVAPLQPPNNTQSFMCRWRFDPGEGGNVSRTLAVVIVKASYGTGHHYPCARYLGRILLHRQGSGENTPLGVICNTIQEPVTFRSPFSDVMLLATKSKFQITPTAFNILYRWSNCGGVLQNPKELTSPGYPDAFIANQDCAWRLDFEEGQHVEVALQTMDFGDSDCSNYLEIYKGKSTLSPRLSRFCSNSPTGTLHLETSSLWVEFHSSARLATSTGNGKGFKLIFTTISEACGGILHGNSGEVSSPQFPKPYPPNTECVWEIRAPDGYRLEIQFIERFNLHFKPQCDADYVQISHYSDGSLQPLTGRLCGREVPAPVQSSGGRMQIVFHSDQSGESEGFKVRWNTLCGFNKTITGPGEVVSPGFPEGYAPNLNCSYVLNAPDRTIIAQFVNFSVEFSRQCEYDNVTVYRLLSNDRSLQMSGDGSEHVSVFCDRRPPPVFRVSNMFRWTFQSDRFVQAKGFRLRYEVETCNENVTKPTEIRSPGSNIYHDMANCTWRIIAPEGYAPRIRFTKLQVEMTYDCYNDYVEVYNGLEANETTLIGRFCGDLTDNLPSLHGTKSQMLLRWVSDISMGYEGFRAEVWFTRTVCGSLDSTLDAGASSSFSSKALGPFEDCQWLAVTVPGHNIQLRVISINIGTCNSSRTLRLNDTKCSCDFLEVRDGSGQFSPLIGRFCGSRVPTVITSSDRALWVRLHTDGELTSGALSFTFHSVPSLCGPTGLSMTNSTFITIQSPGFPSPSPPSINCRWDIEVMFGSERLNVMFDSLDLGGSQRCEERDSAKAAAINGRLEIVQETYGIASDNKYRVMGKNPADPTGQYGGSSKTVKYCGSHKPSNHYISDYLKSLKVLYYSGQNPAGKGFRIQVVKMKERCSMNLTEATGRIVFSQEQEICVVKIEAPSSNDTISLYFSELSTSGGSTSNCDEVGLEVRDGRDANSPLLGRLCGNTPITGVFSKGPAMLLKFWSKPASTYASIDALYTTSQQGRGCGGYINQQSGLFTSPEYPGNYRNSSICQWDIVVSETADIVLWFSVFDLGPKSTCSTDFVEIFDIDENSQVMKKARYCGEDKPAVYRGATHRVAVKYTTTVHNGGLGWVIRFQVLGSGENLPRYLLPSYLTEND